jgi:hypothetical protein
MYYLPCVPLFVPQMIGGTLPPGPTEVKQIIKILKIFLLGGKNLLQ